MNYKPILHINPNPDEPVLAKVLPARTKVNIYQYYQAMKKYFILLLMAAAVLSVNASSSLTNSLTEYSGTSQDNYPAQAAFLAGSGLEASFVWSGGFGAWEIINFDNTGATFGSGHGGSDGRNYLRTTQTDFFGKNFTASVMLNRINQNEAYLGFGTAQLGTFKAPDRGTGNASVLLDLQAGFPNASWQVEGSGGHTEVSYAGMSSNGVATTTGLMQLKMVYDSTAKTVAFSIGYCDNSGTVGYVQQFPAYDVSAQVTQMAGGGRSSIYFGGESGVVFSNLVIVTANSAIDHYLVTASSPQTAGVPFNVTITAQDVNNATVNDSTTTVTVNGPVGSLMQFDWNSDGIYGDSSGTLVNGVKTIKALTKKAGTVTIAAIGGGGGTPAPPSVTITAAAFSQLQILAPGETAAPGTTNGVTGKPRFCVIGREFNVTVNAVDAYWNLVNTVSDNVGITATDSAATLPANAPLVAGTNTFAVTLNTQGNFNLTAKDVDNNTIASNTVTVPVIPILASAGTWGSFPIQYGQTPDTNWSSVPVASLTIPQGTANWDIKDVKVCNDATNLYFLVELWPDSTVNLQGGIENYFWLDTDTNFTTGYVNADGTGVGAEDVLDAWQVWAIAVKQTFNWGVSGNVSPDANAFSPGGNPVSGWPADHGLYYEYSMALAATHTDSSPVFPNNTVTIGLSSRYNGTLQDVIPAFSYTFATSPPPVPANPVAVQVSGGSFSFNVTNSSGSYVVQVNTNLANPGGWTPIYTNTAPFTFTDPTPASAHSSLFYRTVSQ